MSTRYRRETGQNFPKWDENFEKYVQQGGLFVHFSYYPKFGLNPMNEYDTPTAFYSYPMDHDKFSSFGIDRPYAIIFKPRDESKILKLDESLYSISEFESDIEELKQIYSEKILTDEFIEDAKDEALVQTPGGQFWNLTRRIPLEMGKSHERNLKNIGHGPREQKRFQQEYYAIRWLQRTKPKSREEAILNFKNELKTYADVFGKKIDNIKIKDYSQSNVYQGTRNGFLIEDEDERIQPNIDLLDIIKHIDLNKSMADFEREKHKSEYYNINSSANSWSQVIQSLGYEGVYDDGESIIHRNEPWQAAFFSIGSLEIVDILYKGDDIKAGSDPRAFKERFSKMKGGLSGSKFKSRQLRYEDWNGVNLSNSSFDTSRLMGVKLNGANLSGCEFIATGFVDVEAHSTKFDSSRFVELDFRTSNFTRASFSGVTFENTSFKSVNFSGANFSRAEFSESFFDGCEFRGANFSGAFLQDVTFYVDNFTQLETINFSGTSFENCRFSDRTGKVLKKFDSWTNLNNQTLGVDADGNFFQK